METADLFRPIEKPHGRPAGFALLILAAAIALAAVCVLSASANGWRLAPLAAAGLAALLWLFKRTTRDSGWLVCALVAVELLASANLSSQELQGGSDAARTATRYVVIALLCAPAIPRALRSGILAQGGFRLYCLYLAWAAVTILYSLVPVFSAGRLALSVVMFVALSDAVAQVKSERDASRLIRWFAGGSAVVVALLAASIVALPHGVVWVLDPSGIQRFRGFLPSPNQIGALMVTTTAAGFLCWGRASWLERIGFLLLIATVVGLALLADSRSSFVALGAGSVSYLLWRYRLRGLVICLALALGLAGAVALHGRGLGAYATRGNVTTLTGRTDVWSFAISQIEESPILDYGYEVEGAIYQSRYFPLWWGPWDEGPYSSIHNGYLARMVGVGIPATLLWLFFMLRPIVFVFRSGDDPWALRPIALLAIIPILLENMAETAAGDCRNCTGILLFLAWAMLERQRMFVLERAVRERALAHARLPRAVAALSSIALLASGHGPAGANG